MKSAYAYLIFIIIFVLSIFSFAPSEKQIVSIAVPINHIETYSKKYYRSGFTLKFCIPVRSRTNKLYIMQGQYITPVTNIESVLLIFEK
jgi:hypothetical protein